MCRRRTAGRAIARQSSAAGLPHHPAASGRNASNASGETRKPAGHSAPAAPVRRRVPLAWGVCVTAGEVAFTLGVSFPWDHMDPRRPCAERRGNRSDRPVIAYARILSEGKRKNHDACCHTRLHGRPPVPPELCLRSFGAVRARSVCSRQRSHAAEECVACDPPRRALFDNLLARLITAKISLVMIGSPLRIIT